MGVFARPLKHSLFHDSVTKDCHVKKDGLTLNLLVFWTKNAVGDACAKKHTF